MVTGGTITLSQSDEVVRDIVGRDVGSLAALFLLIGVVAGIVGFVIASALSSPFQRLAVAAGNLGRGRFDLELPRTRIPEARAISTALRSSALQLEDRVHRERDFAEHASHVLRTPLTGLRLELEDLTLRDDVPDDVREAAARSLAAVDEVGNVAGELVELSRRGSLVAGSELPLVDLATQLAQRWADRLGVRGRTLTRRRRGQPRAHLHARARSSTSPTCCSPTWSAAAPARCGWSSTARRAASSASASRSRAAAAGDGGDGDTLDRVAQVRSVVESLGGRVTGEHPADGIEVLLPRR